jgi:hypothetical protein
VNDRFHRSRVFVLLTFCLLTNAPTGNAAGKNGIAPPPRRDVPGRHEKLTSGVLYAPDFFKCTNGSADVMLFFLGASWCAEQNFYDARKNGVLFTVTATNWATLFRDTNRFPEVLEEITRALKPDGVQKIGRVCVSSFSGGYVAVRDILRQPECAARVSDVVLADSLYAGRVKGKSNELDADQMAPFLEFARRAAEGKTHFWFSQLFPPEEKYRDNTTTLAAYYLTDHLHVERMPCGATNSIGTKILYHADKGNFHVLGYAGMTNQDHFNHFYGIADLWKGISFDDAR